jgi:hypothetical protein
LFFVDHTLALLDVIVCRDNHFFNWCINIYCSCRE